MVTSTSENDREIILFGLDVDTDAYLAQLSILNKFEKVCRQIDNNNRKLRSYKVAIFKKSTKRVLFEKNLKLYI